VAQFAYCVNVSGTRLVCGEGAAKVCGVGAAQVCGVGPELTPRFVAWVPNPRLVCRARLLQWA